MIPNDFKKAGRFATDQYHKQKLAAQGSADPMWKRFVIGAGYGNFYFGLVMCAVFAVILYFALSIFFQYGLR